MIRKLKQKLIEFWKVFQMPHILICVGLAWMITNGWSYIAFGAGVFLKIKWLARIGGAYLAFLWLPFTPEKILTFFIAVGLHRLIYPNDRKSLKTIKALFGKKDKDDPGKTKKICKAYHKFSSEFRFRKKTELTPGKENR